MTQMITPREQEMLSAYLDNALKPRERQQLETQLQTRPELRAALNELRQTQLILRQAPAVRAPRNFTLTPEMAGLRTRPPRIYPAFQWAFALATLFFIIVLGGETFFGNPTASPANLAMAPITETYDTGGAQEMASEPPPDERIMQSAPMEENGSGAESPEEPPTEQATPAPGDFIQMVEPPTPTAEITQKTAPTEAIEETAPMMENPVTDTVSLAPEASLSDTYATEIPAPETPSFWDSPWRIPEVLLAIVVLLTGLGLLIFRRKTML
ncbi:MAG: hypothetical protein H6636_09770 [Anaerolineales bacterium]|nr:hypothetical protein [Anaerolineales bacterium]